MAKSPTMCPATRGPEMPAASGRENKHQPELCRGGLRDVTPQACWGQRGFHVGASRRMDVPSGASSAPSELLALLLASLFFVFF